MTWAWPTMNRHGLELAACEAVTNAIEHAYPPGRPGPVGFRAAVQPDGTCKPGSATGDAGASRTPMPAAGATG